MIFDSLINLHRNRDSVERFGYVVEMKASGLLGSLGSYRPLQKSTAKTSPNHRKRTSQ